MSEVAANMTRAGITGKVPTIRARRGGKPGKRVRLSAGSRKHIGALQKRGEISAKAAAQAGLK